MKKRFLLLVFTVLLLSSCGAQNETTNTSEQKTETEITEPVDQVGQSQEVSTVVTDAEPSLKYSDLLQSLLDDTNRAHEAIPTYDGDYEQYIIEHEEPDFYFSKYNRLPDKDAPRSDESLTLEQLTEDMEIYYKGLRTHYALYDYFGGDEAFRTAIDAVIADCAALDVITYGNLRGSLEKHFAFVKDAHFVIASRRTNEHRIPFFFRDVVYEKTDSGYRTQDGKVVASVDGYENLDELFRLSLTIEGDLVYYPIVLQDCTWRQITRQAVPCDTVLTVHYADGSSDILTAPDYEMDTNVQGKAYVSVTEKSDIPVVKPLQFFYTTGGNQFLNTSVTYKDSDILIMDFRQCNGGESDIVNQWFRHYTDEDISPNSLLVYPNGGDRFKTYLEKTETFVPSDNMLIVLTSKMTASASEIFIDYAYNLENSMIIGENTYGANVASHGDFTLPNTGLYMCFGDQLILHPDEDGFEEFQGYLPDIWVPAAEAEEAVMNFIKANTK